MRFKMAGNKNDICAIVIRNAEASANIPVGTPVLFAMNGTNDGLDVVLPATGGAAKASFAAGVALNTLTAGQYGEAMVFGFVQNIVLLRQTRSASTADWSSNAAGFPTGDLLALDTAGNRFSTAASVGVSAYMPIAVLAASVPSWASTASSDATADTRLSITVTSKAFVRMM